MKEQPSDSLSFDALEDVLTERADERTLRTLREQLRRSKSARRLYMRCVSLHFWLRLRYDRHKEESQSLVVAGLMEQAAETDALGRRRRFGPLLIATALAASLVLASVHLLKPFPSDNHSVRHESRAYAALVVASDAAAWDPASEVGRSDAVVHEGETLRIARGLVKLRFDSGASVLVKGPIELQACSSDSCRLVRGELVVSTNGASDGFSVLTEGFEVIDLGTEFGVRLTQDHQAEIEVFEGEVQVYGRSTRATPAAKQLVDTLAEGSKATAFLNEIGNPVIATKADGFATAFQRELRETADADQAFPGLEAVDGFGGARGGESLIGMSTGQLWPEPWNNDSTELTTTEVISFADAATSREPGAAAVHRILPRPLGKEGPVYASARFRVDGPDEVCTAWVTLFERTAEEGGGESNLLAFGISDRRFSVRLSPRKGDLAVNPNSKRLGDFGSYAAGDTHLLLVRLEFDATQHYERVAVWIDPPPDSSEASVPPNHVVTYDTGRNEMDAVGLRFWEMDGETRGSIDDLRIGTAWEAVAP